MPKGIIINAEEVIDELLEQATIRSNAMLLIESLKRVLRDYASLKTIQVLCIQSMKPLASSIILYLIET